MIPRELRPLFWDINANEFSPASHPEYTIARVLECGDGAAVAWLQQVFPARAIAEVIRGERRLSRRTANFWALVYEIPAGEVAALRQDGERPWNRKLDVNESCSALTARKSKRQRAKVKRPLGMRARVREGVSPAGPCYPEV
jgi:hypothetical protein